LTRRSPTGAGRAVGFGASGVLAAGATSGLAYAGAPWWAVTMIAVVGAIGATAVAVVQAVFPQDSRDRLGWWRDQRQRSTRQRNGDREPDRSSGPRPNVREAVPAHPDARAGRKRDSTRTVSPHEPVSG
jgi:hypothetical protein